MSIRHFTATAFIVDSRKRTLLLWHKRLQRWMPPGGHIEEHELPEEAARRECKEETGLDIEIIGEKQRDLFSANRFSSSEGKMLKKPFAMLLEEIPESTERKEPAHQHIDFLFIGRPLDESQAVKTPADEGDDIQWLTLDDVLAMDNQVEIFSNVQEFISDILDPKNHNWEL